VSIKPKLLTYNAEPTARLFHNDNSLYRVAEGPVGCGKSVGCGVMELLMRAMRQEPFEGVRATRWAVTRATYPELKSTTIKTFQEWVPDSVCPIVYDVPIRATFRQPMGDGSTLNAEFVFLALESEEDIKKLLSLELTGAWVNELRELPKEVYDYIRGRVGRYPPMKAGGPTWYGVIGDTNPPKIGHWLHELFESEEGVPTGFKLFRYPPAVYYDNKTGMWLPNPDAENLRNLPPNYYRDQIAGNSESYIRNMLAGEYGITLQGKPVFPQFSQAKHVAKQVIKAERGLPLILGWDFGLNPACVFAQLSRRGKLCIVDELSPADEDLESFCRDYVMPLINEKYNGYAIQCVGDPAARGRSGLDKRVPFDVLGDFGLRLQLAPTNAFPARKESVDFFLNRIDAFSISPHCTNGIEGFVGGYVYEKMKMSMAGSVRYKDKAEKNEYSHEQDAIQYIALYVRKGSGAQRAGRMLNGMGNDKKPAKKFLWV
jgi:hypothetical protein